MRPQGAYVEGEQVIIVLCTMFLVSFSINISIFHGWIPSGQTLYMPSCSVVHVIPNKGFCEQKEVADNSARPLE